MLLLFHISVVACTLDVAGIVRALLILVMLYYAGLGGTYNLLTAGP